MQTTYFATFLLGERERQAPPTIDDILTCIDNWIFNNKYQQLEKPQGWPHDCPDSVTLANGISLKQLRFYEGEDIRAIAIRYEHADRSQPALRTWRTDCVLSMRTPEELRFSMTVAAGGTGDGVNPIRASASRPRIVKTIIDRFGAREKLFPLKSTFINVAKEEAQSFTDFLLHPDRSLPIVFFSRTNKDDALLADPKAIADKLSGLAYVCVAECSALSWSLSEHLDNQLNTYDGAMRVYWPRMGLEDRPFRHPVWTPRKLIAIQSANRSLADELLYQVSGASITRSLREIAHWEDIEREINAQTVRRIAGAGTESNGNAAPTDWDKWFKNYEDELDSHAETKRQLETTSDQLRTVETQVAQWKEMYLQALRQRAQSAEAEELIIDDAEAAIAVARKDFDKELIFYDGRIRKSAYDFGEPELLYAAFQWLARTYRQAKMSGGAGDHGALDKSCREFCNFSYHAHQSDVTMGMYPEDYEVHHDGKAVKLPEHLAYGTSTQARFTIRIAFFYDKKSKRVVIGFLGQHQSNRRSN
jgi:hypothetical protein